MTTSLRKLTAVLFSLGIASAGGIAHAGTISFSYSGSGSSFDPGAVASGSGSFTTDDSNNPAGIADLAGFSFSLSVTYSGFTDTYSYALGDLNSFEATFSGGTLTALTLTTDYQPAVYNYFEAFTVTGLGAGDAYTDDGDSDDVSIGSVTIASAAPEPAPFALAAVGLLGLVAARRRRTRLKSILPEISGPEQKPVRWHPEFPR